MVDHEAFCLCGVTFAIRSVLTFEPCDITATELYTRNSLRPGTRPDAIFDEFYDRCKEKTDEFALIIDFRKCFTVYSREGRHRSL